MSSRKTPGLMVGSRLNSKKGDHCHPNLCTSAQAVTHFPSMRSIMLLFLTADMSELVFQLYVGERRPHRKLAEKALPNTVGRRKCDGSKNEFAQGIESIHFLTAKSRRTRREETVDKTKVEIEPIAELVADAMLKMPLHWDPACWNRCIRPHRHARGRVHHYREQVGSGSAPHSRSAVADAPEALGTSTWLPRELKRSSDQGRHEADGQWVMSGFVGFLGDLRVFAVNVSTRRDPKLLDFTDSILRTATDQYGRSTEVRREQERVRAGDRVDSLSHREVAKDAKGRDSEWDEGRDRADCRVDGGRHAHDAPRIGARPAGIDVSSRIDMLVAECIIIENKSVQAVPPIHEAQLLTYLKLSAPRLGFHAN